jgi:gamma-glutamyltranspeptidase
MKSLEMKNGSRSSSSSSLARQRSGNVNSVVAASDTGTEDTTLPLSNADRLPLSSQSDQRRYHRQWQQQQQQQRGRPRQTNNNNNNNGHFVSMVYKFFRMDSSSYSTVSMFDDDNDNNNDDINDDDADDMDEEGQGVILRGIKRTSSKNAKQAANAAAQRRLFYLRFMGLFLLGMLLAFGLGFTTGRRRKNDSNRVVSSSSNDSVSDSSSSLEQQQQQQQHKCIDDPIMALRSSSSAEGFANGAVASDHPMCSQVGMSIMRDGGGNAIDAAVAVALCLGVANPASSGIGGGAFMLIHADPVDETKMNGAPDFIDAREQDTDQSNDENKDYNGKISEVIDCREVAPSKATTRMFADDVNSDEYASTFGGLAVAVPAELRGLELAHKRHGRLPWSAVVKPAMELARNGVIVNANLAHEISVMVKYFEDCNVDYGLQSLLTKDGKDWNSPLQQGDLFANPKLAETLQAIMEQGSDFLYTGPGAAALATTVQNAGGILTQEDIEKYRPIIRTPLVAHDVGGFSIVGVPPPSSGGVAIIGIARFLAGFATPYASFADTLSVHRLVEACRHAFAIRMSLSDPAYNTETVQDAVHDMVHGSYMERLRLNSSDDSTLPISRYGGEKWALLNDTHGTAEGKDNQEGDRRNRRRLARPFGYLEDHGTSHFSVVDGDGNAVAMTST